MFLTFINYLMTIVCKNKDQIRIREPPLYEKQFIQDPHSENKNLFLLHHYQIRLLHRPPRPPHSPHPGLETFLSPSYLKYTWLGYPPTRSHTAVHVGRQTSIMRTNIPGGSCLLLVAARLPATACPLELPALGPDEGLGMAAGGAGSTKVPVGLARLARS